MENFSAILVFLLIAASDSVVSRGGKALQFSGISNKIADLVTEAFTNGIKAHQQQQNKNENRQDAVTIGPISEQSAQGGDNSLLMTGFLKLLGFDGRKIGAAAMNGIVFIAQMVRYGANKLMTFLMDKAMDWVSKGEIVNSETNHVQSKRRFVNMRY